MASVYVMQDRVSGHFGSIFESANDDCVKRDFISLASDSRIPDYAIRDTVVIHIGFFDQDEKNPSLRPAIPRVIIRGDDYEVCKLREKISDETSS